MKKSHGSYPGLVMPFPMLRPGVMDSREPKHERRASVRYSCRSNARLCFPPSADHESCLHARARDISSGGLSLIVSQWFGQGTPLRVELQNEARGVSKQLSACVMHSTLLPDGTWFIGCAFTERLGPEELADFI